MAANLKTLVLETTAPFQGLCELVADKEGLLRKKACLLNGLIEIKTLISLLEQTLRIPEALMPTPVTANYLNKALQICTTLANGETIAECRIHRLIVVVR